MGKRRFTISINLKALRLLPLAYILKEIKMLIYQIKTNRSMEYDSDLLFIIPLMCSLFAPESLIFKQIPAICRVLRIKGESLTAPQWISFVWRIKLGISELCHESWNSCHAEFNCCILELLGTDCVLSIILNEFPPLIVSQDRKLPAATLKWDLHPQWEYQFWVGAQFLPGILDANLCKNKQTNN